ncbi:MAG: ferrous iron transport protein A [Planctomycetes bacterium]|nr:ferrous iron transport protein A [Planctomycetota bacterium]
MFRRRYTTRHRGLGEEQGNRNFIRIEDAETAKHLPVNLSMPIRQAPKNTDLKIVALLGASNFTRRLAELGLGLGSVIQIVQAQGFGPVIIEVSGSRIALGHGMTDKILVKLA